MFITKVCWITTDNLFDASLILLGVRIDTYCSSVCLYQFDQTLAFYRLLDSGYGESPVTWVEDQFSSIVYWKWWIIVYWVRRWNEYRSDEVASVFNRRIPRFRMIIVAVYVKYVATYSRNQSTYYKGNHQGNLLRSSSRIVSFTGNIRHLVLLWKFSSRKIVSSRSSTNNEPEWRIVLEKDARITNLWLIYRVIN